MQSKINILLNTFSRFWVIFFPIASYYFYRYVGFNQHISKAIYFVALPITFIYVFSELIKAYRGRLYMGIVRSIFLMMILSMIMSLFFWDQNLILSYRVTASYLAILYFFFLTKTKPNLVFMEKIIWFFCILYLILWVYGMLKAPDLVFGVETEFGINDSRGIFRLSLAGRGFLVVAFFIAISKFVETSKKYWIVIFSSLFLVIVMHVTRQVIAISFIVGLYYLLKKNKYLWLWLGLSVFLSITFINLKVDSNSIVGKLVTLSENQFEERNSGEENIRIEEYKYFFTQYNKNSWTILFGNGVPHSESAFGKTELQLNTGKDFYASDVGYAEIYIRFGLLGLLLYGLILYKVIRQDVPPKYMYAKLFMLYILITNITASWIFHDVIVISICLYILETNSKNSLILKKMRSHEIYHRNSSLQSKLSKRMY
jgi:hypothetical protein